MIGTPSNLFFFPRIFMYETLLPFMLVCFQTSPATSSPRVYGRDSNFIVCPVLTLCENSGSWLALHLGAFDRQACPTCLATSLQPDTCVSDDGVHQQRVSSAKDFEHVVGVQCSSGRRSVKQHSSWHSRWALTDAVSSHVGLGASAVSPSSLVPQFLCGL